MWGSPGLGCPCLCVSLSEGIQSSPPPTPAFPFHASASFAAVAEGGPNCGACPWTYW